MNAMTLPTSVDILEKWTAEQKIFFFESSLTDTGRTGIDKVINFCRTTDFYTAPSSANHHSNYRGGLLDHTLMVYSYALRQRDAMVEMKRELDSAMPTQSVAISCLLHDICKTCFYIQVEKWKKDKNDRWVSYPGYDVDDKFPIGHGEKSVILLQNLGLEMTPDEMLAIRYHMGHWMDLGGELKIAYARAQDMCPLMTLIQTADATASLAFEIKKEF